MSPELRKLRPGARTFRPAWLLGSLVVASIVAAACTAASPTWTYNPSIGVATPAAGSPGASAVVQASAVASPSAVGSAAPSAAASGAASGSASGAASLSLTAQNVAFDKKDLTAPAGQAFSLSFDNQDSGIPHNVAIYTDNTATNNLFRGDTVTGPTTTTYAVPALPAGTYYFRCDVHPTIMFGTLTVK
ncbi:MAG TPA: cupredoxin domain-containing protein [Candidatus Limnocylindrales bacterium]|nr:cupredoxin domain-containing protein [Candidatus Limnocylindrales bacterium]